MKSLKKQTAINLIAKIISYGSTLLISFFLTPYLVNNLGKEAYSFYPLANNFINYMSIITIALNSMASRFITISLTNGDQKRANTYFASIFFANVALSAIFILPMTVIIVFLNSILNIPPLLVASVKLLFTLVFISMLVNLLTNVFSVAVFSQNRLELGSICEIVVGIVRVGLYIVLFMFFKPTIVYVGVVSLVVALITLCFHYVYTKRLLPDMQISRHFFDTSAIKEVLSSGVWNSVNQVGVVLLQTMGLMISNMLYGATEAADYSVALTIPTFINGIVNMLSSVFMPGLTIKYAKGNKAEIIRHVHITQDIIGIIVNIPIAIFMAVGPNFFALWMPELNAQRLQTLSIMAIGYLIVTSVTWPISNLNVVMNRVKVPALVMVGTGVTNILLVLVAYKFSSFGIYSIPFIQLILFVLNRGIFVGLYTAKSIGEKWYTFYPALFRSLIGTAVLLVISWAVNRMVNPTSWLMLAIECLVLGAIGLVLNALIVLKPSGIRTLVRSVVKR